MSNGGGDPSIAAATTAAELADELVGDLGGLDPAAWADLPVRSKQRAQDEEWVESAHPRFSNGARRGACGSSQVAAMDSQTSRAPLRLRPRSPDPADQEGEILEFFGQLWLVPGSAQTTMRARVPPGKAAPPSLVWIAKEKWVSFDLSREDCYPIGEKDVWVKQPSQLNFAERIWG
jgi:hypothetical protein